MPKSSRLADHLGAALAAGDPDAVAAAAAAGPRDRRDRLLTLLALYELELGPLERVWSAAELAGHPDTARIKWQLEREWLAELAQLAPPADLTGLPLLEALRALAARDRLPDAYRWLAEEADWAQLVGFLAVEGGPDAGFDDLVARCQVGLAGEPKLELARNYWDEMGGGAPGEVHTRLYRELVAAVGMPVIPAEEQSEAALARAALGGLLATNRWLQPEMVGALGMVELQAGPRCRMVLRGFDRCGAPDGAYPFYRVHAEVDPRHGKDWMERAIAPLAERDPRWAPRILRGAWWRAATDQAFFAEITPRLVRAA